MSGRAPQPGFRPDIQGLRAIAVLGVLAYHAGLPLFAGGYLGVDVFFVISGYLIGGQLVRELAARGRIDYAGFYSRRARRILPASLTVIALTVIASFFFAPPLRTPQIVTDAIWAALSAANVRFAIQGTDYLGGTTPSPLQHYWSLGVEEQFYLLAPLLLLGLFVALRARPRSLLTVGILLIVASFAVCLSWGSSSPWTYFALPARAWELGAGVLASCFVTRVASTSLWIRHLAASLGALGLVASTVLGGMPGFAHPGVGTLLPVVATVAIILAGAPVSASSPIVTRALSIRPMQLVGGFSFSLYLVHWPMLALAQENSNSEQPLPLASRAALALFSIPMAWLVWKFVEQPFIRRKISPRRARQPLIVAGVTTAAMVIALSVSVPALAARPMTSNRVAATGSEFLPRGTPYVPSNLEPSLADAGADTGALYTNGCQQRPSESELKVCSFGPDDAPTVVLFGDSHAGRWFSALSAAFDGRPVRLVTLTKSGCRSLETADLWAGAENGSCAAWRSSAVDWLHAHPPQLLVLANHLGRSTSPPAEVEAMWSGATESTLARFPSDVPVAILAETPEFDFSPPVCLSRHITDAASCSQPRSRAIDSADIRGVRSGARPSGAAVVDLTDWFCNATSCPAVIGSSLVYTDEHHLSATFSAQLGATVYSKLAPLFAASR